MAGKFSGMKIFVTGKPGCGKSTLIREIMEEFSGKAVAGVITPEIRDGGRTGFEIMDIASGKKRVLASVDIKRGPRVSKYGVNVKGIDEVVEEFYKGFYGAEIVFIDEIGSMEFFSARFKSMIEEVCGSDKTVVATLHRNLARKFAGRGGRLYELKREDFNEIKRAILGDLGKIL